jgi:hypothetical protein
MRFFADRGGKARINTKLAVRANIGERHRVRTGDGLPVRIKVLAASKGQVTRHFYLLLAP